MYYRIVSMLFLFFVILGCGDEGSEIVTEKRNEQTEVFVDYFSLMGNPDSYLGKEVVTNATLTYKNHLDVGSWEIVIDLFDGIPDLEKLSGYEMYISLENSQSEKLEEISLGSNVYIKGVFVEGEKSTFTIKPIDKNSAIWK